MYVLILEEPESDGHQLERASRVVARSETEKSLKGFWASLPIREHHSLGALRMFEDVGYIDFRIEQIPHISSFRRDLE